MQSYSTGNTEKYQLRKISKKKLRKRLVQLNLTKHFYPIGWLNYIFTVVFIDFHIF